MDRVDAAPRDRLGLQIDTQRLAGLPGLATPADVIVGEGVSEHDVDSIVAIQQPPRHSHPEVVPAYLVEASVDLFRHSLVQDVVPHVTECQLLRADLARTSERVSLCRTAL